jgi:hypothetical protein
LKRKKNITDGIIQQIVRDMKAILFFLLSSFCCQEGVILAKKKCNARLILVARPSI